MMRRKSMAPILAEAGNGIRPALGSIGPAGGVISR